MGSLSLTHHPRPSAVDGQAGQTVQLLNPHVEPSQSSERLLLRLLLLRTGVFWRTEAAGLSIF